MLRVCGSLSTTPSLVRDGLRCHRRSSSDLLSCTIQGFFFSNQEIDWLFIDVPWKGNNILQCLYRTSCKTFFVCTCNNCSKTIHTNKFCNRKQITCIELDNYWSHKPVVHLRIFSLYTVTHFYEFQWENWLYMFQIYICQLSNKC